MKDPPEDALTDKNLSDENKDSAKGVNLPIDFD